MISVSSWFRRRSLIAPPLVLVGILSLAQAASGASYSATTSAGSGWTDQAGPSDNDSFTDSAPVTSQSSSSVSVTLPGDANGAANGVGYGFAGTGLTQVWSQTFAAAATIRSGVQSGSQSSGTATALFTDSFTIVAPGLPLGTPATLTVHFNVLGGAGGSGHFVQIVNGIAGWSGTTFWRATADVNGASILQEQIKSDSSNQGLVVIGNGQFGTFAQTLSVTIGSPVSVTLRAEVSTQSVAGADFYSISTAEASFGSSLTGGVGWGGIAELRDENGDLVENFSAPSTTVVGFDYREPVTVPEPGLGSSIAGGAIALMAALRGRSRRPALDHRSETALENRTVGASSKHRA